MISHAPHHNPVSAVLVSLLVSAGRLIGRVLPLHNPSGLFFFFPFYHTGGAEKVHADIVSCFAYQYPWVFFLKRSREKRFWKQFTESARCFDIGMLLKYTYPFSAGVIAALIEKHPTPRLFGCNSLYYYMLLPHLDKRVRATDLLHALGGGAEQFSLPVLGRLSERVVISAAVRNELKQWYSIHGVAEHMNSSVTVIPNNVEVPEALPPRVASGTMKLLFAGRGTEEKRLHIITRAAQYCLEQRLDVEFTMVGEFTGSIPLENRAFCKMIGSISDPKKLAACYQDAHIVLITSSREGFPLAVMEGMAHGCVPVCTSVGGIPEHIRHLENGWLLPKDDDDAVFVALYDAIVRLHNDRRLIKELSEAAYQYAVANFGGGGFCEQYRRVIEG